MPRTGGAPEETTRVTDALGLMRGAELLVFALEPVVQRPEGRTRAVFEQGEQMREMNVPAARVAGKVGNVIAAAAVREHEQDILALRRKLEGDLGVIVEGV